MTTTTTLTTTASLETMPAIKENAKMNAKSDMSFEPHYSRTRVIKRGVRNIVDTLDPIYKGAKMGAFALHGIPTWARENMDGKLANDSHGWAATSAAFVVGCEITAYAIATNELVHQYGAKGYALLAVPIASQAVSYVNESFRRAKKTELSDMVLSRVRNSLNAPTGEYDLTNAQLVDKLATGMYEAHVKEKKREERERARNRAEKQARRLGSPWPETGDDISVLDSESAEDGDPLKGADAKQAEYVRQAEQIVMNEAKNVLDDLFAGDRVNKSYRMDDSFVTGPRKANKDRKIESHYRSGHEYFERRDSEKFMLFANVIDSVLKKHGGSANIELFGQMTSGVEGQMQRPCYDVKPGKIWDY